MQTFYDFILNTEEKKPNHSILEGKETLNFPSLMKRMGKVRSLFSSLGLKEGDSIAIGTTIDSEVINLFLSSLSFGVSPIFLDDQLTKRESQNLLKAVKPKVLFVDEDKMKKWDAQELSIKKMILIKKQKKGLFSKILKKQNSEDETYPACLSSLKESPAKKVSPKTRGLYLYTSGTTGDVKIVPLSHENLLHQGLTHIKHCEFNKNTKILNLMPLTHIDGMVSGILLSFLSHSTMVRGENFAINNMMDIMELIYNHDVTHIICVPTILSLLLSFGKKELKEAFEEADQFKFIISTGGPLSVSLWSEFENTTKKVVVNNYGMTEIGSTFFTGLKMEKREKSSVGRCLFGDAKIVDENFETLDFGHIGELLFSAPTMMDNYLLGQNPFLEEDKMKWFSTGDLARLSDKGHFEIIGRKKNIIISGGRNIYPEEINNILLEEEGIVECATFSVPDKNWGERSVAAIILKEESSLTINKIMDILSEKLSPYKVPRELFSVSKFPKNRSGKTDLEKLRGTYLQNEEDLKKEGSISDKVLQIASETFRISSQKIDLNELSQNIPGWDSMAHLDLITKAEKTFGVEISGHQAMDIRSLNDLMKVVEEKGAIN
ncbi:AMP-binding protein [Bacteriovoracales bacterium]|nr:AMP-binding protein [Bacteriovoracales bacterium]